MIIYIRPEPISLTQSVDVWFWITENAKTPGPRVGMSAGSIVFPNDTILRKFKQKFDL